MPRLYGGAPNVDAGFEGIVVVPRERERWSVIVSQEEVERFVEDIKTNAKIQADAKSMPAGMQTMLELGKRHGYDFTEQDVEAHAKSHMSGALTEEQLESVTGGAKPSQWVVCTHSGIVWYISN